MFMTCLCLCQISLSPFHQVFNRWLRSTQQSWCSIYVSAEKPDRQTDNAITRLTPVRVTQSNQCAAFVWSWYDAAFSVVTADGKLWRHGNQRMATIPSDNIMVSMCSLTALYYYSCQSHGLSFTPSIPIRRLETVWNTHTRIKSQFCFHDMSSVSFVVLFHQKSALDHLHIYLQI